MRTIFRVIRGFTQSVHDFMSQSIRFIENDRTGACWHGNHVGPTADDICLLTRSRRFHSRSRIDSVAKQAVPRHTETNDTRNTRSYRHERLKLQTVRNDRDYTCVWRCHNRMA